MTLHIEVILSWAIMGCLSGSGGKYNLEKLLGSCFSKIDDIHVILGIIHIKQVLFSQGGQNLISWFY